MVQAEEVWCVTLTRIFVRVSRRIAGTSFVRTREHPPFPPTIVDIGGDIGWVGATPL